MVNVGVLGYGYWGPNLVRNLFTIKKASVKRLCDLSEKNLERANGLYPSLETTHDDKKVIDSEDIDAVIIATPISTHYSIVKRALEAGKHVFVEKPMTNDPEKARELIELAKEKSKVLMVGHTFLYNDAVRKVKEIIESGEIGKVLYVHTSRLNLGLFQPDSNVVWDLMPHDLSMILYFIGDIMPNKIIASGYSHYNTGIEDTAQATLIFPNDVTANIRVSWLDPLKVRNVTVVGTKKMVVFDDTEPLEKVKIYDKGVEDTYNTFGEFQMAYRYGDIYVPKIRGIEALKIEMSHFLDCIENNKVPLSDGENGYKVVKLLNDINNIIKEQNGNKLE